MRMKTYFVVHLLNDYSGSPRVLSNFIDVLNEAGIPVHIFSSGNDGFLTGKDNSKRSSAGYLRSTNKYITLFFYLISQFYLFFKIGARVLLIAKNEKPVTVVNTLLPFGAALGARLAGGQVVYYVHETSIRPLILKRFLKAVLKFSAYKVIYVSDFLKEEEGLGEMGGVTREYRIYNSLPKQKRKAPESEFRSTFVVLMPCSLKQYKGVYEFIEIAKYFQEDDVEFVLALNAEENEYLSFLDEIGKSRNLKVLRRPSNLDALYEEASLVLNLSRPDEWVETFGMTVIEAFEHGCPVIVPEVGGISELVSDGFNGYKISVNEMSLLKDRIKILARDQVLMRRLSSNAKKSAEKYSFSTYKSEILAVIEK